MGASRPKGDTPVDVPGDEGFSGPKVTNRSSEERCERSLNLSSVLTHCVVLQKLVSAFLSVKA
jgi:hypothetical protein